MRPGKAKKCAICDDPISKENAKYCSRCSYFYYNYTHTNKYKDAARETIEAAVKERIKIKNKRLPSGAKPKFLRVREAVQIRPDRIQTQQSQSQLVIA